MDSKKYNNIKLAIGVAKGILSFIFILLFVYSGASRQLSDLLYIDRINAYVHLLLFVAATGLVGGIISFPVKYYTEFYLEHKYNLSNQTFVKWIWEDFKGLLLSLAIGIPVLLLFYYIMNKFGSLWWLPFAIALFLLSVILARVVPVFILPLFYKLTPIEDEELVKRINKLAEGAGIKLKNVFRFDMSKNTRKANAAFTGIGKSKRILLGDTLLDNFDADQIETVLAHEMGHYKKKHIIKNIFIGTISSFLMLFLIAAFYDLSLNWFGFNARTEIPALPLLTLWGMLIGLILTPVTNLISRKYEYEADAYAIEVTGKPEAFVAALQKLTEQNLGDKDPNPFVEWFFYSHPSIKRRVSAINKNTAFGTQPAVKGV